MATGTLSLSGSLSFLSGQGAPFITTSPRALDLPRAPLLLNVVGKNAIKYVQTVGTADATLDLGQIGTIGYVVLRNLEAEVIITTPGAPTVVTAGTPGAATWTYKIVAKQADGAYSAASSSGSIGTGNATLDNTNYNTITWTAVTGATSYDVYRTAHGTTPSTNGLIGNTTALTLDDKALAGDSASAPSAGIDNVALIGGDGVDYPVRVRGNGFAIFEGNSAAIHHKRNTAHDIALEVTIIEA